MRALVLGGTRFIGLAAVRALSAVDHEVAVFHRGNSQAKLPAGVTELLGDRHAIEDHREELLAFRPDVVLDMLALTEADMQRVLTVFRGQVKRLVVISSCDVYRAYDVLIGKETGYVQPCPLSEDSELRTQLYPFRGEQPRAVDDYDKILVERAALSDPDYSVAVLRLPMVYGPRDFRHRLFTYIKRIDDGRPAILLSATDAQRRFARGFVDNVGHAIALAVTADSVRGVYNVAEEPVLTELDWVRAIAQATGWGGQIVVLSDDALPETMRFQPQTPQDLDISSQKIRAELGYSEVVTPSDALAATIAWERVNPPEIDPAQFDYEAEDAVLASA